uniref:F-box only protein 32 n=1 Tax=Oncorhynchus kisutch TaxID=8019 RepID=A0A8C7GCM6_ONCKI
MPFLGQDWRSPGQSWVKTEEGWKNYSLDDKNSNDSDVSYCKTEDECFQENLRLSVTYDMAAKKRRKDCMNNNAKIPYFHKEKWIYVHKGSTKERHGYCTLGEAFNRLDFCSAIKDNRRFNYVVRLLELIAKSQLPSLSGVAQKNYMNILERVVQKVLGDQQNVRPIKELLQTLYVSLCGLVQDMGKSVLVGNINCWVHRMENILQWQQQLDNIQINRPVSKGMTLTELPASLQLNIMERLSDGRDLVSLGQVTPDLGQLTEDRLLWKRLCQYHFTDRQIRKRLMVSDKGQLEWKKMYFKLCRCYPVREQYSETLQFCTHCHILFWKVVLGTLQHLSFHHLCLSLCVTHCHILFWKVVLGTLQHLSFHHLCLSLCHTLPHPLLEGSVGNTSTSLIPSSLSLSLCHTLPHPLLEGSVGNTSTSLIPSSLSLSLSHTATSSSGR